MHKPLFTMGFFTFSDKVDVIGMGDALPSLQPEERWRTYPVRAIGTCADKIVIPHLSRGLHVLSLLRHDPHLAR